MKINELLSALNEAAEQEFIAPGFPGFYSNSIFYPSTDDVQWNLFNNPDAVPDEILDWCCENCDVDDWEGYKKEVCEAYIDELNNALSDILPNFHAEFVEVDSPREYNYETDKCVGKVDWLAIKDDVKKYIEEHKEAFAKWIKDNHSSYPGFISYYSNDANEWNLDGELDYNEIGSILGFIINNEGKDDDEFGLDYAVWENVNPYFTFDMEELKKNFKFDVEPETSEDLENYVYDEETNTYKWNADAPGQMKLQFESAKDFLMQRGKVINEQKK